MGSSEQDRQFYDMAVTLSASSIESGKHVGAVIVGPDGIVRTTGFNGLPRGIKNLPERHSRETGAKYLWSVHAEINAICNATLDAVTLKGCTIYTTHFPCASCAKAIVQCGIIRVVSPLPDFSDVRWADEWRVSEQMFLESGMEHTVID